MSSRFNRLMGCLAALAALAAAAPAWAISPNIVVSQVYGGGGNSGATYRNDFIELFNRGSTTVSVTGWSVQYASATGSTWQVTNLAGTIQAGKYYLVQEAAQGGGTQDLPTPDATGSIPMSATTGKVALVNSTTMLSGTCPTGANIIDFVGYGGANCFETAPTAALSNTTAAIRNLGGCTDTDNNLSDFTVAAPTPRNSASPANPCGNPPTGSCCHTDYTCQDNVTEANCAAPSVWTEGGMCAANCLQGACCTGESCSITTQIGCSGTWQGAGTTCSPTNPCLAPTGSCCHTGYICEDGVTQANCAAPAIWTEGGVCAVHCTAVEIRVATYNLLNFNNDTTSTSRHPYFRTVLSAVSPDVLVVQEIANQTAVDAFRTNVLNGVGGPGGYTAATFTDTSDALDQAVFYRSSKVAEITGGYAVIPPVTPPLSPRNAYRWQIRPASDPSGNSDLFVYSMHLAASDAAQRAAQTTDVRSNADSLPAGANVICVGDFNIDSSSETSYQNFIGAPDSTGRMYDPIESPGIWNDSVTLSYVHTQSTHKDNNTPESPTPAGAATGGLDDRFDFLLISAPLRNGQGIDYITGTYQAFGNDGQHLNIDINDPPTIPEGVLLADALHAASDHLPVYMNLSAAVQRLRGDFNANGVVDLADIGPFVTVLLNPTGASETDRWTADMDGNGTVNGADISGFVNALL
jgi:endonuclease/exonuclease/phosphatase family metal-dependent hydrolase